MTSWLIILGVAILGAAILFKGYRRWKAARIAARRVVEKPNSFYSSTLVKGQVDRARWGRMDLSRIHPLNREEVERLLNVADTLGPEALSSRERLFLETLTELSFGC